MADLIQWYRKMAAQGASFHGLSIIRQRDIIRELILQTRAVTLLDYGCGRGEQYLEPHWIQRYWQLEAPTLYDPAFPEHDKLPTGTFDGVLCSDVLEHVLEPDVDETIARLFSYARLFVWSSVCCRPAKKSFPDGTNMHVTVKPIDWWKAKFKKHSRGLKFELTETF